MAHRGFINLLESEVSEKGKGIAGKISELVKSSDQLIRNIEVISRIYKSSENLVPVSLDLVVRTEVSWIGRSENLVYHMCGSMVYADDMLGVIFLNLFQNSIIYGGPDVTINITCTPLDDRKLQVKVEDTGPGIPDAARPLLFMRFSPETGERGAHGLGLKIVKILVDRYGGTISVLDRVPKDTSVGGAIQFTLMVAGGVA